MKKSELRNLIREELTRINEGSYSKADAAFALQSIMSKLSASKLLDNNMQHKFKNIIAILKSSGRDNSNMD